MSVILSKRNLSVLWILALPAYPGTKHHQPIFLHSLDFLIFQSLALPLHHKTPKLLKPTLSFGFLPLTNF